MEPSRHPSIGPSQGRPGDSTQRSGSTSDANGFPPLELQQSGQPPLSALYASAPSAQNHQVPGMTEQLRRLVSLVSLLQQSSTTSTSAPVASRQPDYSTLLAHLQRLPESNNMAFASTAHQDLDGAHALAELIRQSASLQSLIAPGTHAASAADEMYRADSFSSQLRLANQHLPLNAEQNSPSISAPLLNLLRHQTSTAHTNFSPLSFTNEQVDETLLRLLLAQQHQIRQQEDQQELMQCILLLQQQKNQERERNSILQLNHHHQQQHHPRIALPCSIAPFPTHSQISARPSLNTSERSSGTQTSLPSSTPHASATINGMDDSKSAINGMDDSKSARKRKRTQAQAPSARVLELALPTDEKFLSPYQLLLRQQLELFSSDLRDCLTSQQGRRRRVQVHQVGLRCRHCAHLTLHDRGRASCYYPQKLIGIYQAAQNIATTHLAESCACIPAAVRDELRRLHERKDTAAGGKAYWADACVQLGLEDGTDGIYFAQNSEASTDVDSSEQTSSIPRFAIGADTHH